MQSHFNNLYIYSAYINLNVLYWERREWKLTNCCLQICQPLLKLLLQKQFFFGVAFGKGRQQETHSHGGASHTEQHCTSQLTNIQCTVETDGMAVTRTVQSNHLFATKSFCSIFIQLFRVISKFKHMHVLLEHCSWTLLSRLRSNTSNKVHDLLIVSLCNLYYFRIAKVT